MKIKIRLRKFWSTEGEKLFREQLFREQLSISDLNFSLLSPDSLSLRYHCRIFSGHSSLEIGNRPPRLRDQSVSPHLFFLFILASIQSVEREILERKMGFSCQNCHSCLWNFRPICPRRPTGLWSSHHHEPNASGLTSIDWLTLAYRRKENLVTRNFQAKFMELYFDSDFMASMKVYIWAMVNVMVKFGDHQR